MEFAISLLLELLSVSYLILATICAVFLVGLIKTRSATGNTISNAMIVERTGLFLIFLRFSMSAYGLANPEHYHDWLQLTSYSLGIIFNTTFILAMLFIIFKD